MFLQDFNGKQPCEHYLKVVAISVQKIPNIIPNQSFSFGKYICKKKNYNKIKKARLAQFYTSSLTAKNEINFRHNTCNLP